MGKLQILFYVIFIFATPIFAADPTKPNTNGQTPTYSVSGEVHLITNFIDRGLTMSDGNPAMNADFLFNFGQQLKLGVWGSNISNLNDQRDNFWLKVVGEVHVEFSKDSDLIIYFHDNHFYKSDGRNGQQLGGLLSYKLYSGQFEWSTNFEGSGANAFYLSSGVLFPYKTKYYYGGYGGYTSVRSDQFKDYIDLKALGVYKFTEYFLADAAITYALNGDQFSKRGGFQFYIGLKLQF